MSRPVQEKLETRVPREPEGIEGGGWATDASARRSKERLHRTDHDSNDVGYNQLPPGMNTYRQDLPPQANPRRARGGLGSGTQATEDVTRKSVRQGFSRKAMSPTDDYARGENEPFYETVEVDGVEGFVERGNVLDRM